MEPDPFIKSDCSDRAAIASSLSDLEIKQGVVEYRGYQSRKTIFSEIDVLVHPSTTFDSLPTALIEAARAGIPCIASSNGGAAEIVEEANRASSTTASSAFAEASA